MANSKIKAQVAIEFTVALFCLLVLLVATTKIFVWFGHTIVQRHTRYEETRTAAATEGTTADEINFYDQTSPENRLGIFKDWKVKWK